VKFCVICGQIPTKSSQIKVNPTIFPIRLPSIRLSKTSAKEPFTPTEDPSSFACPQRFAQRCGRVLHPSSFIPHPSAIPSLSSVSSCSNIRAGRQGTPFSRKTTPRPGLTFP
jgi:hypothetical protein